MGSKVCHQILLQLSVHFVSNDCFQLIGISAFCHQADHSSFVPENHRVLAVFAVGQKAVVAATPEQVSVTVGVLVIFYLFSGTFTDPLFGEKLPAVPAAVLQIKQSQFVKFGNG